MAAFAGTSVLLGTGAGAALYSLGTISVTVTTLGLETTTTAAATASEGGLASFSIQQLNTIIRGTQRQLLNKLFGQGMEGAQQAIASGEVPVGITRETLMVAKEIAQRAIARGIDKGGVQAVRLKIIEEALKKNK